MARGRADRTVIDVIPSLIDEWHAALCAADPGDELEVELATEGLMTLSRLSIIMMRILFSTPAFHYLQVGSLLEDDPARRQAALAALPGDDALLAAALAELADRESDAPTLPSGEIDLVALAEAIDTLRRTRQAGADGIVGIEAAYRAVCAELGCAVPPEFVS